MLKFGSKVIRKSLLIMKGNFPLITGRNGNSKLVWCANQLLMKDCNRVLTKKL